MSLKISFLMPDKDYGKLSKFLQSSSNVMPQTFTPWKAISTPLHKIKNQAREIETLAVHHYAAFGLAARIAGDFIISIAVRRKMTGYALLRFRDLLPLQSFTEIFEKSTSLPVISVQTEPSSFCSLVISFVVSVSPCHLCSTS